MHGTKVESVGKTTVTDAKNKRKVHRTYIDEK